MSFKGFLASICLLTLSTTASATLITFDNIAGGSVQNSFSQVGVHAGYNISTNLHWIDVVNSGWNFGAVSGDFALLNNYSGVGIITATNNADFYFGGIWAKRWATAPNSGGADNLSGFLRGMKNNQVVWQVTTGLNGSYKFFGAQNFAIDQLELGFGNHFLADNLTLTRELTPNVNVPEPSSVAILGLGLLGLLRLRKKS